MLSIKFLWCYKYWISLHEYGHSLTQSSSINWLNFKYKIRRPIYSLDEEKTCDLVVANECGRDAAIKMIEILIEDINNKVIPNKKNRLEMLNKRLEFLIKN